MEDIKDGGPEFCTVRESGDEKEDHLKKKKNGVSAEDLEWGPKFLHKS